MTKEFQTWINVTAPSGEGPASWGWGSLKRCHWIGCLALGLSATDPEQHFLLSKGRWGFCRDCQHGSFCGQATGGELGGQVELSLNYCFLLAPRKDRNGFSLCLFPLMLQRNILVAAEAPSAPLRESVTSLDIIRSRTFSWPENQTAAALGITENSFPSPKFPL